MMTLDEQNGLCPEDRRRRRPYQAPELTRVRLEADQVLGIGCKTTSGGSASGASPCTTGSCAAEGS